MDERLFNEIDALYPEYVNTWVDVCNIESQTKNKAGVDAVGEYFIKMANERGWDVDVHEEDVSGNAVCITMNKDAKGQAVCLSGHMDTVHPAGLFGTPAAHIEGDKIYGPGVIDCKGGVVVGFLAMDALRLTGFTDRPVKLILQSDEENSSWTSEKRTVEFMCEKAKGARAFLNLEGHDKNTLCIKRKGIITFEFTVNGVAGHASKCATLGANAIHEAAHKIIELEKFKNADGLTCCCSLISGGTAQNTIPEKCVFRANVRFATNDEAEYIKKFAMELAEKTVVEGCHTTVEIVSYRVAMEYADRNERLVHDMNAIYEENGLAPFEIGGRLGGSDAAYTTMAGIPTIDNIGVEGGDIHSVNEFAYLSSLPKMAKRIALAVKYL